MRLASASLLQICYVVVVAVAEVVVVVRTRA